VGQPYACAYKFKTMFFKKAFGLKINAKGLKYLSVFYEKTRQSSAIIEVLLTFGFFCIRKMLAMCVFFPKRKSFYGL
jgi:hypothetical protein